MADIILGALHVLAPGANVGAPGTTALGALHGRDVTDGGGYQISDVVKVQGAPAPIAYRVLLLDQQSKRVVRETWCTPGTGVYTFARIRQGLFLALALDHTGTYDPEAKADLQSEPMM